jgi:hypothetical protein
MLAPAIARVLFALSAGIGPGLRPGLGPPRTVESVLTPALVADALILAALSPSLLTVQAIHSIYCPPGR